jgi:hypothetical protein
MPQGCPFLVSQGGGWRLDVPSRDHRCAAVSPPAALSLEKQQRLCLTNAHVDCATYLASLAARERALGRRARCARLAGASPDDDRDRGLRRPASACPRAHPGPAAVAGDSRGLLVTTLFTLGVSGLRRWRRDAARRRRPSHATTAAPVPRRPTASRARPRTPTGAPDARASPAPSAEAGSRPSDDVPDLQVKSGDTLSGIASRSGPRRVPSPTSTAQHAHDAARRAGPEIPNPAP